MKIHKTENYIKKESQFNLPGDPNYPPGIGLGDIEEGYGFYSGGPGEEIEEEVSEDSFDEEMVLKNEEGMERLVNVRFGIKQVGDNKKFYLYEVNFPGSTEDIQSQLSKYEMEQVNNFIKDNFA